MAVKFGHKRLTKPHYFYIRFSYGVEVGAAFCSAHRQTRQTVFESLLESEKFKNTLVDRRMKTQPALVRSDSVVELYAVSAVYVIIALRVFPYHSERNNSVRFDYPL